MRLAPSRALALSMALALATALAGSPSARAAWPDDQPIEVVVGFAPGGGTDLLARKLLPFVQQRLGPRVQFVVQNRPGAAGEIANAYVARAKPDGYTLAMVNVPGFVFLPMTRKTQYAPEDFALIARAVDDPTVMVTKADSRFDSLQAVLDATRRQPGSVSFGHSGVGTNGDLALQLLGAASDTTLASVAYKGGAAMKVDLLGGHLDVGMLSIGEVPELHPGAPAAPATLRVLAQLGDKRSPALPQVPTARELGLDVLMSSERGFAAPRGVPAAIVQKLERAFAESLADPAFIASAPTDAPVLAYLPGGQWTTSLQTNRKLLAPLASPAPGQ